MSMHYPMKTHYCPQESEWVEKEEPPTEISLEGLKVHSMNTE